MTSKKKVVDDQMNSNDYHGFAEPKKIGPFFHQQEAIEKHAFDTLPTLQTGQACHEPRLEHHHGYLRSSHSRADRNSATRCKASCQCCFDRAPRTASAAYYQQLLDMLGMCTATDSQIVHDPTIQMSLRKFLPAPKMPS